MIQVEGGKLNCMLVAFRSQPARTTSLNEQSFISSRNGNNNFQISNDNTALFSYICIAIAICAWCRALGNVDSKLMKDGKLSFDWKLEK